MPSITLSENLPSASPTTPLNRITFSACPLRSTFAARFLYAPGVGSIAKTRLSGMNPSGNQHGKEAGVRPDVNRVAVSGGQFPDSMLARSGS